MHSWEYKIMKYSYSEHIHNAEKIDLFLMLMNLEYSKLLFYIKHTRTISI